VGPTLPGGALRQRLTGRAGTIEVAADCENLKGWPYKKRLQTSVRRQPDWSLIGKNDEVELFERRGQSLRTYSFAADQLRP
jgi:hypothetical protein